MTDKHEQTQKSMEEIFNALNDPNNPFRELVTGMFNYWKNQGFDDDQARFLSLRELGWNPPPNWRVEE